MNIEFEEEIDGVNLFYKNLEIIKDVGYFFSIMAEQGESQLVANFFEDAITLDQISVSVEKPDDALVIVELLATIMKVGPIRVQEYISLKESERVKSSNQYKENH